MNISMKEFLKVWIYVAMNSFGGPAGQIAVIHKIVVEEKKLISEQQFLRALNFCMLLPGPEAQQLATYMGWLMKGTRGGLISGLLFILPGFLSILIFSYLYVLYRDISLVQGIFYGIKPAIIAIVLAALIKISKKALCATVYWTIALVAFTALFFFNASFPFVICLAAFVGIILHQKTNEESPENFNLPPLLKTLKTISWCLIFWAIPFIISFFIFDKESNFHNINFFFSKMALVTFGGAYASLSYMAQQAVEHFSWLYPHEMIDGLALAETTPGPLIQVVQFVGFMGAYRFSEGFNPLTSALIGSFLSTWMTFAPCFLFIFTFAPYLEFLQSKRIFQDALRAISAAVVGVILNLSLWFMINSIFQKTIKVDGSFLNFSYPQVSSLDIYALLIGLVSIFMQFKMLSSILKILGVSIILGILVKTLL